MNHTHNWRRYVAIGDSFTEGLNDQPLADGPFRGWADLLAQELADRVSSLPDDAAPGIQYANLAIRGKLLRPILAEQLPQALALKPDLISIIGGGNDNLRVNADVDELAQNLDHVVERVRARGIDVLLGTAMDNADSPVVKLTRGRVGIFNSHIWSIAQRHGAYVLDLWGMRSLRDWRMWDADRIHLTTGGHARVAQGALAGLGLTPADSEWDVPLPDKPQPTLSEQMLDNARWTRDHVAPWVARHLRGVSSGDGLINPRSELRLIKPAL